MSKENRTRDVIILHTTKSNLSIRIYRVLVAALSISLVVDQIISNANPTENSQLADDNILQNAKSYLKRRNAELAITYYKTNILEWNYYSNMTKENLALKLKGPVKTANASESNYKKDIDFLWTNIKNKDIKRQLQKFKKLDEPAPPGGIKEQFDLTVGQMVNIYSVAKICNYKNRTKCDLALEPEITEILMNSRDPEELKHIWVEWMKTTGRKVKPLYPRYVELANTRAKFSNLSNHFESWLKEYETENFMEQVETLWEQLKPLYLQLHAYVRRELRKKYGEDIVSKKGPIPGHLLGNMWGLSWANIADFTLPFPGKQLPNVTDALVEQGYNATSLYRLAENFYKSINLSAMTDMFWEKSILTKRKDVDMVCHATAWNLGDGKDFRIMQCTRINYEDLLTAHHEMGHIEYYMQYKDQPTIFQAGANPAFHEAIGDVIALSVSTPNHLKKIGLYQDDLTDPEAVLNNLYVKALDKIPSLAFSYLLEQWRRGVFQEKITPDNYNCDWWSLVEEYQGIEPPVNRSEKDFDPGTFFHVIANFDCIRYFVSFVIQFQFHKALCIEAKQYDPKNPDAKPLHQCDIYENKNAGNLLKSMLQMGSSRPWPDAMEKITKQRQMDLSGLLEYFKPVIDWLTEENKRTNEYIGWLPTTKRCVQTRKEL